MGTVYISADSFSPADHVTEKAYFYGGGPGYPAPIDMDSGGAGEQNALLPAGNTRGSFVYGGKLFQMLADQTAQTTIMVKSSDNGATWSVADSLNSLAFDSSSGYFDSAGGTVTIAYISNNAGAGALRLIVFDLITETWGAVLPSVGPMADNNAGVTIWVRSDGTYLVIYPGRLTVTGSGISAVAYDPIGATWGTPFDPGINITTLPGWDATQTGVSIGDVRSIVDPATGIVHLFFGTLSLQTVPVVWGNRVFYQQILLDNSTPATVNRFFDFPGQVAPFPAFPYNTQQLNVFSGVPFGNPVIVGSNIVLPVSYRNDSVIDRFPHQLPTVYLGTPISAPVWSLPPVTDPQSTIDPGTLVNDLIWIQEAPCISFDGNTMYVAYSAQADDGSNLSRIRLCSSSNLANPQDDASWSATTIFDLTIDAPPGFNFVGQFLSGAGVFTPLASPPLPANYPRLLNSRALSAIPLPRPKPCKR